MSKVGPKLVQSWSKRVLSHCFRVRLGRSGGSCVGYFVGRDLGSSAVKECAVLVLDAADTIEGLSGRGGIEAVDDLG